MGWSEELIDPPTANREAPKQSFMSVMSNPTINMRAVDDRRSEADPCGTVGNTCRIPLRNRGCSRKCG